MIRNFHLNFLLYSLSIRFILKNIDAHNKLYVGYIDAEKVFNIDNIGNSDICNFATNGLRQSAFTPRQMNSSEIHSSAEM